MKTNTAYSCALFLILTSTCAVFADDKTSATAKSVLISKPDAFQTLVNPECSHCRDEALRRASQLKDDDRVLSWTRGYSDGGAIPYRFFLNPYRVISDSYGVFVYDPDAGFSRGFEPSYDFKFHGWRNGVMVMSHKDGSLFSCLTGIAFEGPQKGTKLKSVPTLVTNWGSYLKGYPGGVAYKMFDKYQPLELPAKPHEDSRLSRIECDQRLEDQTWVLGVVDGSNARAYPIQTLSKVGLIRDEVDGQRRVILWNESTQTASAYRPVGSPPKDAEEPAKNVTIERSADVPDAPFVDKETGSHWDVAGRAIDGELKGWTLKWIESTQARWFAWSAEYPETTIHGGGLKVSEYQPMLPGVEAFPKPHGNLDASARRFGVVKSVDELRQTVSLTLEGDSRITEWPIRKGVEFWTGGAWDNLNMTGNERVWAWFDTDNEKTPLAISFICDELSEQLLYAPYKIDSIKHGNGGRMTLNLQTNRAGKPISRVIELTSCIVSRKGSRDTAASLKVGEVFYFDSAKEIPFLGDHAWAERFKGSATAQRDKSAFPGTIVFVRPDSNEIEVMFDHAVIKEARSLAQGDTLGLSRNPTTVQLTVQKVRPWQEKTQVLFTANPGELSRVVSGERIIARPSESTIDKLSKAESPLGRVSATNKLERIEWIASTIYCTCGMHDECAGHFYTLAACDSVTDKPCGLAKRTREMIGEKIDRGETNEQILAGLLKDRGEKLLRPHMMP